MIAASAKDEPAGAAFARKRASAHTFTRMTAGGNKVKEVCRVSKARPEEEFETRIARNLQTIIRIGKPQMIVEWEARQEAIKEIVKICLREMDKQ